MTTNIFTFSGEFGSGKTNTSASFIPPNWTAGIQVKRDFIDPEMRSGTYASKDGIDHPALNLWGIRQINKVRLSGAQMLKYMTYINKKDYSERSKPDVLILDDTAKIQDIMTEFWQDRKNAEETARLYGLHTHRVFSFTWKPKDAGTTSFFKTLFEEFLLDLKEQDIYVVVTSPLHNLYADYGTKEQRVIGQSAKVWDVWQKLTDVIWIFDMPLGAKMPTVSMDPFIKKAALPGIPESFTWPGWETIWKWHEERTYQADTSKLKLPEPKLDPESVSLKIKEGKYRLIKELDGIATVAQIKEILEGEYAPVYDLSNHDEVREYIKKIVLENKNNAPEAKSE